MKLDFLIEKKTFIFKTPSGTSRGILTEKHAWYVSFWVKNQPEVIGIGECSIIPGLSPDFEDFQEYERIINGFCLKVCNLFENNKLSLESLYNSNFYAELINFPSVLFGIEMSLLDLIRGGNKSFFDSEFNVGKKSIPINGLIWMGSEDFMQKQILEKIEAGFSCIKMKIGAIDFETEYKLLKEIRNRHSSNDLILRVDANGAFKPEETLEKLKRLSELEIHSIEQPIAVNQHEDLQQLCELSPLPIALDEELIGVNSIIEKRNLLKTINPTYIILKPSLHGGIIGTQEWIKLAEELSISWWITSALESNVGLNCIAQLAGLYPICYKTHQGLGTGSLYVENTPSKLLIENGYLSIQK